MRGGSLKAARKVGLGGAGFHDLHHTHATVMLQQGVHPKIVQERLRHATIAVTLDTYSHLLPGMQEAAPLRFEEGLAHHAPDFASENVVPEGPPRWSAEGGI